jgi:uncharacterized coiled-coil protein SlyX
MIDLASCRLSIKNEERIIVLEKQVAEMAAFIVSLAQGVSQLGNKADDIRKSMPWLAPAKGEKSGWWGN